MAFMRRRRKAGMPRWVRQMMFAAALAPGLAQAATPAEFYKGRQMVLLLSTESGGGYAGIANALLPRLTKYIPGQPRVIIQYMPGAGGIRAMNYMYAAAPKDGTMMAIVQSTSPYAPLFGIAAAKYDPRRMNWIGSLDNTSGICVAWGTSGIKTWEDVLTKQFVVGSSGAGSQMETFPMMINKLFGTKMKVIAGYKGGNEVFLAMERGEVHGRCGSLVSTIASSRPDWLPQKKVSIPFQVALERNPQFPDSPAIAEFAKDEHTKRVLQLLLAHMTMDKPVVMPPGVPPERVAAIRAALHAAMNDPGFLADIKKQRILVNEVSGDKVASILAAAYASPPDVVKSANEAMDFSGGG
jgi:tripartite-type tricarboxylate transporter receptor subunit TctC